MGTVSMCAVRFNARGRFRANDDQGDGGGWRAVEKKDYMSSISHRTLQCHLLCHP